MPSCKTQKVFEDLSGVVQWLFLLKLTMKPHRSQLVRLWRKTCEVCVFTLVAAVFGGYPESRILRTGSGFTFQSPKAFGGFPVQSLTGSDADFKTIWVF